MVVSLKAHIPEPVFWHLQFQCINSVSQFFGICMYTVTGSLVYQDYYTVCKTVYMQYYGLTSLPCSVQLHSATPHTSTFQATKLTLGFVETHASKQTPS